MSIAYKYKRHWDERKTIKTIEELKSVSDKEKRYDFFELNHIVENNLGFNTRGCGEELAKLGLVDDSREYYDYWHYQLEAVFRRDVCNESANSIYVGTKDGIDYKKVKKKPNVWQKFILEKWNELLYPIADEKGWIKVVIWW